MVLFLRRISTAEDEHDGARLCLNAASSAFIRRSNVFGRVSVCNLSLTVLERAGVGAGRVWSVNSIQVSAEV